MDKIERIHRLLDELAEATKEAFPDYSRISALCSEDGYQTFNVIKWGNGKEVATTPRRDLFDQTKIDGKWLDDSSERQNKYYEEYGLLLKG